MENVVNTLKKKQSDYQQGFSFYNWELQTSPIPTINIIDNQLISELSPLLQWDHICVSLISNLAAILLFFEFLPTARIVR